jgi:hypothetical protein
MLDFIITNIDTIFIIITSIVSAASAIAALTPTTVDDGIVAKIRRIVDVLALNIGNAKTVKG